MLDLSDNLWRTLDGGYRCPYDATHILRTLMAESEPTSVVWEDVWNNLYHQYDIGVASYAVMPWLIKIYSEKNWIDYQLPAYAFAIEQARSIEDNPPLPDWMANEYRQSIEHIMNYCLRKRADCDDPNFKKAFVLLSATMIGANDLVELLDSIALGDEQRAVEIYDSTCVK